MGFHSATTRGQGPAQPQYFGLFGTSKVVSKRLCPLQIFCYPVHCLPQIVITQNAFLGAPELLVIWAQLHTAGSNLAVCLRAGPELPLSAAFARDKRYALMRVGDTGCGALKPAISST